jgi:hypothetical protein
MYQDHFPSGSHFFREQVDGEESSNSRACSETRNFICPRYNLHHGSLSKEGIAEPGRKMGTVARFGKLLNSAEALCV